MRAQTLLRSSLSRREPRAERGRGRLLALPAVGALLVAAIAGPTAARTGDVPAAPRREHTSIAVQVLPPIHQHGTQPASSTDALGLVVATLSPPRSGWRLTLERKGQHGWKAGETLVADAAGHATFAVPPRDVSYRVVAESSRWQSRSTSAVVRSGLWGAADFDDEFAGTTAAAWKDRIQFYNPWGGRACSKGSPSAVRAGGGTLELSSMPDPAATAPCPATNASGSALGDFPYRLNGHVSTQRSFDFLYGVAAARMKFQRDPGAHAAFWLQPRGLLEDVPTPWGAEVDVVEWFGRMGSRDRMTSTVHAPMPSGGKVDFGGSVSRPSRFLDTRSDTWWRGYHVFSVEWTPTEYVFRIDDHEVWRTDQGVSHDPEFLILSMLSSDYELPRLGERQDATQTASVDWVKVWQGTPGATGTRKGTSHVG